MNKREDQRRETHRRIVEAAVELLVERGYAAATALGVQQRVGISRGALLHHFPTSESLLAAAVERLVEMNLDAVREEFAAVASDVDAGHDPVARGVWVLYRASRRASFATEMELWAATRADEWLRQALLAQERVALAQLQELTDEIFGPEVVGMPAYRDLATLTVQLLRGITVTDLLGDGGNRERSVSVWIDVMRAALDRSTNQTVVGNRESE